MTGPSSFSFLLTGFMFFVVKLLRVRVCVSFSVVRLAICHFCTYSFTMYVSVRGARLQTLLFVQLLSFDKIDNLI